MRVIKSIRIRWAGHVARMDEETEVYSQQREFVVAQKDERNTRGSYLKYSSF